MTAHTPNQPPELLKLLAHDLRWSLLSALTESDHRVQELVARVNEPMNLVSYHLKKLRHDGIVSTRRSEADGRDVYYSLDLARLRELYQAAGAALHPGLADDSLPPPFESIKPLRVLFVCTHNSARSQMAEGLLRHRTNGQIEVYSAGSHPTTLHPDAVQTMDALGIDIRDQHAKPLSDVEGQAFDDVITVCDRAREVCPTFPGGGRYLHWGFADPVTIADETERRHAFAQIADSLASRIDYFLLDIARQKQSH